MLRIQKKLREAHFFLAKMTDREQKAFGDHEEFDFYLSAFLSAARSVDYRLRYEQKKAYKIFYGNWENALSPDEKRLMKFMADDRKIEVHQSGSARVQKERRILVYDTYQDKSGSVTVSAPPGTPPAVIAKPTFFFSVNGLQMSVLDYCRQYIKLLERLVREYYQSQCIT
jgi:hypothetical protein